MGLLTKDEEKRFQKEREVMAIESSEYTDEEYTDEEYNVQPEEPPQRTTRGPVQVDVVATREQPERRPTKRRKVIADNGEGRRPELRMAETQVTRIRMLRTRAKPKKKANRRRIVSDSSESSVAKSDVAASKTDEEKREEPTLQAVEGRPSGIQVEVPMEEVAEPSEEWMVTVNPNLPPSEQMRSMKTKEVTQPKTSEELAKKLTLSEEILE